VKKHAYTIFVESLKETDYLEDQATVWG
jgi:hypothetical protein